MNYFFKKNIFLSHDDATKIFLTWYEGEDAKSFSITHRQELLLRKISSKKKNETLARADAAFLNALVKRGTLAAEGPSRGRLHTEPFNPYGNNVSWLIASLSAGSAALYAVSGAIPAAHSFFWHPNVAVVFVSFWALSFLFAAKHEAQHFLFARLAGLRARWHHSFHFPFFQFSIRYPDAYRAPRHARLQIRLVSLALDLLAASFFFAVAKNANGAVENFFTFAALAQFLSALWHAVIVSHSDLRAALEEYFGEHPLHDLIPSRAGHARSPSFKKSLLISRGASLLAAAYRIACFGIPIYAIALPLLFSGLGSYGSSPALFFTALFILLFEAWRLARAGVLFFKGF